MEHAKSDLQQIEDRIDASAWVAAIRALRSLLLDAGLTEVLKWRKPCYALNGTNVAIIQSFKNECRLMFFKGVLLDDPKALLTSQGENTQGARVLRVTSAEEVAEKASAIRALIDAAIDVEKTGEQVAFNKRHDLDLPSELVDRMDADPEFAAAFHGLTPGRQRSWVLHFTGAKQSATRAARIDRVVPDILAGGGWNERR